MTFLDYLLRQVSFHRARKSQSEDNKLKKKRNKKENKEERE